MNCMTLGPVTRSQRKKAQIQEDNEMLVCMMEALNNKDGEFEYEESMELNYSFQFLLLIEPRVCVLDSINSRSSILCVWGFELKLQILNRGTSNQGGDLERGLDPILQAQEDSYHV
ncbi:hypothetical protein M9H77_36144 [Catharanthus roseus]|uniref:Uncharacterized protein n=1 Tax=Catharanthus roseus TaxID=4058 RepID=A0ACB9ZRZ4_CATRO|nr:hypothetical protein M9H77_36144 [Catharanthus roseus]